MSNKNITVNTYYTDPENPHIVIKEFPDPEVFAHLEKVCPAELYWHDDQGYHYDYKGCLECGSCAVIGNELVFMSWNYPRGSYGIDYSSD